jgi:phosphopantetheine adenylyltransferase
MAPSIPDSRTFNLISSGLRPLANYKYEQKMAAMNDSAQYVKSVLQYPLYIHDSPLDSSNA